MHESAGKSSSIGNFRWVVCLLLFSATLINYMDRQILGLLAPLLQKDIGWTEQEYGHLVTAFQAAYAIGLVCFGRLVDRYGTKIGYTIAIAIWSMAAIGHSLARNVVGFGVARFALGIGESGNFPTAIKVVAEWFPQQQRALATGLFNCGSNMGALMGPLVVPLLALHFGWRSAFITLGTLDLVWLCFWLGLYETPEKSRRVGSAELAFIKAGASREDKDAKAVPLALLLKHRELWACFIIGLLTSPVWWFYLYWLPKFLNSQFGLNLTQIGLPLVIIYGVTSIGSIGGGWLSSKLISRGNSVNFSRKLVMGICALGALPVMFITHSPNIWVATLILGVAAAANQGWSANTYTLASDLFPTSAVATVVGIGSMLGSISAMIFSETSGYLLQTTGSYTFLFVYCGSIYFVALSIVHLLVPRMKRVPLDLD